MSKGNGRRQTAYTVVDFDNVTEQGLKSLLDDLKRAGSPVSDVEANNRKAKKDMVYVKKAKLFFENGQTATLFIGDQGDIYQLVVNGKKTPLPDAKNERQFAQGLNKILERGQEAFDKSQLRKAKQVKNTSTTQPASRSLKKRAEEARQHIATLQQNKTDMDAALSSAQAEKSTSQDQVNKLTATLEAEKQETKDLKQQIDNMQESMH
ncbi:phage protein [Photobacterium aphoticum]|uniref:Phage protein n=1 Tax=Photobacterium aphoticum TaxID=754436 RepID=A0A090QXR0_9GAMM|nr:phage protein [Photobacterium aphoticum]